MAAAPPATGEATGESGVLGEDAQRYLVNLFQFHCAPEYVPYLKGDGPPVPTRSAAEWTAREQKLESCRQEVTSSYTTLDAVRAMTWNGKTHTMSEPEMQKIVALGPAFLEKYAKDLLRSERRRERFADAIADGTQPAPSPSSPGGETLGEVETSR